MPYTTTQSRFGEQKQIYPSSGTDAVHEINHPSIDIIRFHGHWENAHVSEYWQSLFRKHPLHTNTRWLDFTGLFHHAALQKDVLLTIPPHVDTLEICLDVKVSEWDDATEDVHEYIRYEFPQDLVLLSTLSRLIIHYPPHFSRLKDFNAFLTALESFTEEAAHLQSIYFCTSDHIGVEVSAEEAANLRAMILSHVAPREKCNCRFYRTNAAGDNLISSHQPLIKDTSWLLYVPMLLDRSAQNYDVLMQILSFADMMSSPLSLENHQKIIESHVRKREEPRVSRREHTLFKQVMENALYNHRSRSEHDREAFDERFGIVPYRRP